MSKMSRIEIKRWASELEGRSPVEILFAAAERFAPRVTFATGFGAEGCVIVDLVARHRLPIGVFTLDTGVLFPETYDLWRRLEERYGMTIRAVRPAFTLGDAKRLHEPLWETDPDRCCDERKVLPLRAELARFDAWVTAIRRDQTPDRAGARVIEWDGKFGLVKVNPLAGWSVEDVASYARRFDVPLNPLHAKGYPSIGCAPCTTAVRPGEDPRAGRWRGRAKTECGVHGRFTSPPPRRRPTETSVSEASPIPTPNPSVTLTPTSTSNSSFPSPLRGEGQGEGSDPAPHPGALPAQRGEGEQVCSTMTKDGKIQPRPPANVTSLPIAHRLAGFILWFTGLSGAGKSTLSRFLEPLFLRERPVEILDGDEVRTYLSKGLGFSKEDRDTNIRRIGYVARLLARNGVAAVTAAISPYAATRDEVRDLAEKEGIPFIEVFVEAPLETLIARDVKGLYKRALAGEIAHFTGVSDPYEPPEDPELVVRSDAETVEQSAARIVALLRERGLVRGEAEARAS